MIGLRAEAPLAPDLPTRLAAANVFVSVRGNSIRVSPHLYNTTADVDRFISALAETL
jgi:selenocysteine lyase/cysteine desulfurase